jgi:hypothetical protein
MWRAVRVRIDRNTRIQLRCHIVSCRTKEDRAEREKKVVVLGELCRAIIYTTVMSIR